MTPFRSARIIARFDPAARVDSVRTFYDSNPQKSAYARLDPEDVRVIDENWRQYPAQGLFNGSLFHVDRVDVLDEGCSIYGSPIDFKAHIARNDARIGSIRLSEKAINEISVLGVGALVETEDHKFVVRKRVGEKIAPDRYDCGSSGTCVVKDGETNPAEKMRETLKREIGVEAGDIQNESVSGIGLGCDYGGYLVHYRVHVKKTFGQMAENLDRLKQEDRHKTGASNLRCMEAGDLRQFILDNHGGVLDDLIVAVVLAQPGRQPHALAERVRELFGDEAITGI
ncbi:MAG TPA: hypothetical protein VI933_00945 [archaeon]|nr:hypothetical protein [archaeon]